MLEITTVVYKNKHRDINNTTSLYQKGDHTYHIQILQNIYYLSTTLIGQNGSLFIIVSKTKKYYSQLL